MRPVRKEKNKENKIWMLNVEASECIKVEQMAG